MATRANQREDRVPVKKEVKKEVKKQDAIPAGVINPQKIYTPAAIAANAKVPLTDLQSAYVGKVASERLQAESNAFWAANPDLVLQLNRLERQK